jgi:hypothetical protein
MQFNSNGFIRNIGHRETEPFKSVSLKTIEIGVINSDFFASKNRKKRFRERLRDPIFRCFPSSCGRARKQHRLHSFVDKFCQTATADFGRRICDLSEFLIAEVLRPLLLSRR